MKYLMPLLLLIALTVPAYAQEEPAPDTPEKQEPQKPPLALTQEEVSRQIEMLGSRFLTDRISAQSTVARVGKAAIPYLKSALESDNTFLRMNAVELLGRMKQPEALPPIVEMFGDSSPAVRRSAARAIEKYGKEAIPELDKLVASGKLGQAANLPDAVLAKLYRATLIELFRKVDQGGQYPGQYATIAELGPKTVPALLSLLDDSLRNSSVVPGGLTAIIGAIADFKFKDKRVVDKLEYLWKLGKDNQSLRQAVAIALAKLGEEAHFQEMLKPMLESAKTQTNDTLFQSIALMYHRTGNYDESQKWFRRAAVATNHNIHYYNLACACAMGKKLDEAVDALKKAIELRYVNFKWMVIDKELDPVRKHAGYIELLKKHCPQYLPENPKEKEQKKDDKEEAPEKPEEGAESEG